LSLHYSNNNSNSIIRIQSHYSVYYYTKHLKISLVEIHPARRMLQEVLHSGNSLLAVKGDISDLLLVKVSEPAAAPSYNTGIVVHIIVWHTGK